MTREIDLHGMTAAEGKRALLACIRSCPAAVTELTVIHGSHSGNALQQMVRRNFSHLRLERKLIGLNDGVTVFLLKPKP